MKIFGNVFKTRGVEEKESKKMVMSFIAIKTLMYSKSLGINEN